MNEHFKNIMSGQINTENDFEWADEKLSSILIGNFEHHYARQYYYDQAEEHLYDKIWVAEKLKNINTIINDFNTRNISPKYFLLKMKRNLRIFSKIVPRHNIGDISLYSGIISKYRSLLISGDGGIGKSHFLFKLEETLTEKNISHLCIYGKFFSLFDDIDWKEIQKESRKKEFILIFDAVNEISEEARKNLIRKIKPLMKIKRFRIIVSYRTKRISSREISKFNKMLKNKYEFLGVNFENAIIQLIEQFGIQVSKFEDILNISNPLYLSALRKALFEDKVRIEKLNGVTQITFLLEALIKSSIDKATWKSTKIIAETMYKTSSNKVDFSQIEEALSGGAKANIFIEKMESAGFLSSYEHEDVTYYIFSLETLSQYLISRNLFSEIANKNEDEIVDIVNSRISSGLNYYEAFALVLFDFFQSNITIALNILRKSTHFDDLGFEIFRKINFSDETNISVLQKECTITNKLGPFSILGGIANKPYNCVHYFNNIFNKDPKYLQQLDENIEFNIEIIQNRLHNILYFSLLVKERDSHTDEFFWFAFWCAATIFTDINKIAVKILFQLTNKFSSYIEELIENYSLQKDDYLRTNIIKVLSSLSQTQRPQLQTFFESIAENPNEINSTRLYYISNYLYKEKKYINWTKRNVLNEIVDGKIDSNLHSYLMPVYLYEKELFSFDAFSDKFTISFSRPFISNSKKSIAEWNTLIEKEFSCMLNENGCGGYARVEKYIKKQYPIKISNISNEDIGLSFQRILFEVANRYNYKLTTTNRFDQYLNKFYNSKLRKIIVIARDELYGSFMCNYFTHEFIHYNDELGFKVFDQYEYGLDYSLYSPISIYNDNIPDMMQKVINRIILPDEKKH